MWAHILNVILGVWLMFSPTVLDYDAVASTMSYIVGPMVSCFAYLAIWSISRGLRWANLPLGIWLVIAPWIFHYSLPALFNSLIVGAAIMLLSAVNGPTTHSYGGGWSSLWSRTHVAREEDGGRPTRPG
jgi:hypothetical protein